MPKKISRLLYWLSAVSFFLIVGCSSSAPLTPGSISPSALSEFLFSFVIIADPHITGDADTENALRLVDCVEWINTNEREKSIEMVVIVGDISWGNGLPTARSILDQLAVPYLPIIGDNVIQNGNESAFETTFSSQFTYLATIFDNWQKASLPVWNPELDSYSYFQNFSFDYKGIHFMGIDWCSRTIGGMAGEQADLHDFSGGTWPWFTQNLRGADKLIKENIVMFTHHPMHVNPVIPIEYAAFSPEEDAIIETFTAEHGDNVYADFAGHYHIEWSEWRALGQYHLYVTKAAHTSHNMLKLINVSSNGNIFSFQQELITSP